MSQDQTELQAAPNIINRLAGITDGSTLDELRRQRADALKYAQGSFNELLDVEDPQGLSRYEREMVALRVAILNDHAGLVELHRGRLRALGASEAILTVLKQFPVARPSSPRENAILRHVDRLTRAPATATPEHIAELKAAGLSASEIVTLAQLIAFMSFQVRVLTGLRLLAEER